MRHQNRVSLTEKLISNGKSKPAQRALDSFRSYKKTVGIIDKVNIALGKKSVYTTTSNSTLNTKIISHGIISTTEI